MYITNQPEIALIALTL